jgi:hypothetical protein
MSGDWSQSYKPSSPTTKLRQASPFLQTFEIPTNTLLAAGNILDQAVIHINHVRGLITVLQPINSNNRNQASKLRLFRHFVTSTNTLLADANKLDQAVSNISHVREFVTVLQNSSPTTKLRQASLPSSGSCHIK